MPAETIAPRSSKTLNSSTANPAALPGANMADEASQTLKRTGEAVNQMTGEALSCCSDTLAAALQAGTEASMLMSELSRAFLETCSATSLTFAEIMRESLACRTPADLALLQDKGMNALNGTLEASTKHYNDMFSAYSRALEPLMARAANAPERMFRAIAD